MSAAAGPAQSSPPPTSAAVLEFICLFTHDLRRKQKRWQDGRLKYHAFNKRVMVYDDRGNFVGDLHWRRDYDFDEGEEIQLERGGVIVQVQELIHRTEQDLSELLDKRAKEKEQRQVQAAARPPARSAALPRTAVRPIPTGHSQTRHRPLHQVIGTPSGHHGRAVVPKDSPYEQRHQPVESPEERAAKRRKHNDSPPSKSGYAQALFGQSLTLSATPMSSFPVRRLPARETVRRPEPSSPAETNVHQVREEPTPALREQAKSSRHFNQPAERLSSVRKPAENRPVHDVEVGIEPHVRRKQDRTVYPSLYAEHQNDSSTADDDVIEIENPYPPAPVRPNSVDKPPTKSARIRKQMSERPNVNTLPAKSSRARAASPDGARQQTHEYQDSSKPEERLAKHKSPNSNAPKPAVKKSTAQVSAPKKKPESQFDGLSRRPSEPITELRIKSSKKRGLLMVSEIRMKPREHRSSSSAVSCAASEETRAKGVRCSGDILRLPSPQPPAGLESEELERKDRPLIQHTNSTEVAVDDNLFRSPSPSQYAGLEKSKIRWKGQASKRRKDSTELGEGNNAFRAPSPAPLVQKAADAGRSVVEQSEDLEAAEHFWEEEDVALNSKANLHTETSNLDENRAAKIAQHTAPPPPRRRVYDPYQLPSSSAEELSNQSTRAPPSPTNKAFLGKGPAPNLEFAGISKMTHHAESVKKTGKSKKISRAQRNIVLDEEDLDDLPEFPDQVTIDLDEAIDSDYDANANSSKKQAKLRRPAKDKKSSLRRHDKSDTEKDSLGDDPDEAEPERALTATKRKARFQHKSPSPEAEEQPQKRRRSTRGKPRQSAESEDTCLPSEQDDFEDKSTSRISYKNKTRTVKEDRPRLTTIKKSVKSRELIGFDLTALHAPLGLGGIGVPFSILSRPVNELTTSRVDDEPTMNKHSDPTAGNVDERLLDHTADTLAAIVEAGGMALPAKARIDENWTRPTSPPDKQLASGEITGEPTRSVQPVNLTSTEELAARRSGLLGGKRGSESSDKMDACSDVSLQKEASAFPSHREKRSSGDAQNKKTAGPVRASVELARASKGKGFLVSAVSTNKPKAEIAIATTPNQASVEENHTISDPDAVLEGSKSAIGTWSISMASAVRPTGAHPEVAQDLRLPSSRRAISNMNEKAQDVAKIPDKPHAATKTAMPSVQKKARSLPQQSSRMSTSITNDEASQGLEVTESVREGSAPVAAQPFRASAHNPTSDVRRPPAAFPPVTKVKNDAAHAETETSIVETLRHDPPPQKPTPALPRQSSDTALVGSAETRAAVENPHAVQSNRPERAPAALIQAPKSLGLRRTTSDIRRVNKITVTRPEPEPPENPAGEGSTKPARIANPASRGRKAALKSDAAGQVPQRVLPLTQPSAMVPISTADLALTPLEEPPKEPERPKKKMTFPGFQSARNEGPWSREAFDLLETGRPE